MEMESMQVGNIEEDEEDDDIEILEIVDVAKNIATNFGRNSPNEQLESESGKNTNLEGECDTKRVEELKEELRKAREKIKRKDGILKEANERIETQTSQLEEARKLLVEQQEAVELAEEEREEFKRELEGEREKFERVLSEERGKLEEEKERLRRVWREDRKVWRGNLKEEREILRGEFEEEKVVLRRDLEGEKERLREELKGEKDRLRREVDEEKGRLWREFDKEKGKLEEERGNLGRYLEEAKWKARREFDKEKGKLEEERGNLGRYLEEAKWKARRELEEKKVKFERELEVEKGKLEEIKRRMVRESEEEGKGRRMVGEEKMVKLEDEMVCMTSEILSVVKVLKEEMKGGKGVNLGEFGNKMDYLLGSVQAKLNMLTERQAQRKGGNFGRNVVNKAIPKLMTIETPRQAGISMVTVQGVDRYDVNVNGGSTSSTKSLTSNSNVEECELPVKPRKRPYNMPPRKIALHGIACPTRCLCGAQYNKKAQLTQHLKLHLFGKQFPCRLCDKAYKGTYDLKMHYFTSHGKRLEVGAGCWTCGMLFKDMREVREHSKDCHNMRSMGAQRAQPGSGNQTSQTENDIYQFQG